MKKISTTCTFVLALALVAVPALSIEYCKDFLEPGNNGGWENSLKTFEDEWTMKVSYEFDVAGLRYLVDRLKELGEVQKGDLIEGMLYE